MAEESTENSTSSEQPQSNENITIPPISKPAAGAVARLRPVAHRRERQSEVVRNHAHVLDVPRKSGTRRRWLIFGAVGELKAVRAIDPESFRGWPDPTARHAVPHKEMGRAGFEPA